MKKDEELKSFRESLPFTFKDTAIFEQVFVHTSYTNEKEGRGLQSNERLEFLGDAVLSTVVSSILYRRFPSLNEGELTKARARLINRKMLATLAVDMGMGPLMLLGKGEKKAGAGVNPNILSSAFEALVAAVCLDRGYNCAYSFIERLFSGHISGSAQVVSHFDFKPKLQEVTQMFFKEAPFYRVVKEEGPAHKKLFSVEVSVKGEVLGAATSTSKKDAQQVSARKALEVLEKRGYTA